MKKDEFDNTIKKCLQEQVEHYRVSPQMDARFQSTFDKLCQKEMEEQSMKHFPIKKAIIVAAAAVMVLGSITTIAAGGIKAIKSSSSAHPNYTNYADLSTAEKQANVITNAPKTFSNGYTFSGITVVDQSYMAEDETTTDTFTSLSIDYTKASDSIFYKVQPRPIIDSLKSTTSCDKDGIVYYYTTLQNKFVPADYKPTAEEQAQVDAGTLNIGYGTDTIEYSESKQVWWETNGQQHSLFCMDNTISIEELLEMAYELN